MKTGESSESAVVDGSGAVTRGGMSEADIGMLGSARRSAVSGIAVVGD